MVCERENSLIEDPIVGTSQGWRDTMTDVADLPSLDCVFRLGYLAARMRILLELRIQSARHG